MGQRPHDFASDIYIKKRDGGRVGLEKSTRRAQREGGTQNGSTRGCHRRRKIQRDKCLVIHDEDDVCLFGHGIVLSMGLGGPARVAGLVLFYSAAMASLDREVLSFRMN